MSPGLFAACRWVKPTMAAALIGAVALMIPWVHDLFVESGQRWFHVLLLSGLTALALTPLFGWVGERWGIIDQPDARKIHQRATPRTGGIAVYIGFSLAVLINAIVPVWMGVILIAASVLVLVGLADDAWGLPASMRLLAQLAAAGLVMVSGHTLTLFPPGVVGDAANIVLTLVWIVGITNALNFMDGMDGLAAGLAILMSFFMGLVAFETQQPGLGWLAIAIMGAGLGFLPYNFRRRGPALVFLGDHGATFLGFTMASLAVKGEWADHEPIVSLSNPILIFVVLIYDMVHVTVERIVLGKVRTLKEWIDYVGRDHLHHRLAYILESRQASVLMIYALAICFGLSALALREAETPQAVMLLLQAALILTILTVLEHRGRAEAVRRREFDQPAFRGKHVPRGLGWPGRILENRSRRAWRKES